MTGFWSNADVDPIGRVKAEPCGMCGNDAYVMVCPPMTHFEFAKPSWLCGQKCLDRFKVLLRLDGPTDEALLEQQH